MNQFWKKLWLFIIAEAVIFSSYEAVAQFTLTRGNARSFITSFDALIPFIPETSPIYVSIHILWLVPLISGRVSYKEFANLVKSVCLAFAMMYVFYILIPSTYPRPVVTDLNSWTHWLLAKYYSIDLPNNTFPSSHVATATLTSLAILHNFPRWIGICCAVWAVAIMISTLTVKQHHGADMVTGFALGVASFYLVRWLSPDPKSPQ